ncbi:MAG: hypothetical protein H6Q84_1380 [Deltaproteobacteria bacterium]|nr:hypothetical protein [Deltaproteobacteria bacterium]
MPDLPITYRGVAYPWQCDHARPLTFPVEGARKHYNEAGTR